MTEKIMASLESLPTKDLLKIRENLDELIRSKYDADLGKRKGKRAKVKITGQGKELFSLINLSRNRLTQKTKAMA